MSNIVFSDAEVRMIGGNRWVEKNQKKYTRLYQLVALLAIIGTLILWVSRDNLLVLIVLVVGMGGSIYLYTRDQITGPMHQAGIDFLKEYRS